MHSNILLAFQNLEATYPQHKCFPENSTWARFSSCFSPRSSQSPALQEYFFLLSFLSTLEVHVHLSLPTQGGQACLEHLLGSGNFCRILTLETVSSPGLPWGALRLCQLPGPLWGPLVCSLHLSLPAFLSDKQHGPVAECLSFGAGEGQHSVLGSLSVTSAIYSLGISGPGVMFLPLSAAVV